MKRSLSELLGARYPVIQGGMTFGSDGRLVAAVCNAGGLGTLGTFHYRSFDEIARQLEIVRAATDRPFAVNVPFFENNLELVRRAADQGVRIFTLGGWCSDEAIRLKEQLDLVLLVSVNSPTIARYVAGRPFDLWIAQGNESGGANGEFTTLQLFEHLRASDPRPVVLAGGQWDGHDLYAALLRGAAGIQLGTRFFFSAESPLHLSIKERVIEHGRKRPTTTRLVRVGDTLQMRFIVNKPLEQGLRDGSLVATFGDKQQVYDLSARFFEEQAGSLPLYAGAAIHKLREIQSCDEIVREIVGQYNALVADRRLTLLE